MRLYSTPQSAKILEVSFLAIMETIAAVSFSLWLAISYLGTWYYVLIGACVAPWLLLRTDFSCHYAITKYLEYQDRFDISKKYPDTPKYILVWMLLIKTHKRFQEP